MSEATAQTEAVRSFDRRALMSSLPTRPSSPTMVTLVTGVMVIVGTVGCGDSAADAPTVGTAVVTDSARVRIVTHPAAVRPPLDVGPEPIATLGREGDDDYLFAGITGVVALEGGRVVVAERDGTIRFFAPDGTLAGRAGGEGEGPGEFAFLATLRRLPGDTLAAADGRRGRTMFFAPDGRYLDEVIWSGRVPEMPEGASQCFFPNVQAVLDDRRLLMWGFQCITAEGAAGPRDYVADVLVVGPEAVARVANVPILTATEDPGAAEPILQFRVPAVYGRPALAARGDLALVAIPSLGYRVRGFRSDGSLAFDLRDGTAEPPLGPELRAAIEASWSPFVAEMNEGAAWPETLEGWDVVRVFSDGRIWARRLQLSADPAGEVWSAYSMDGTERTRYRMPPGFALHDVRDGRAWGVAHDALDVEEVVAFLLP